jgi:guanine deaminase
MSPDEKWLTTVIEFAVRNVHEGGGPFSAVIVAEDTIVGTGQNRVTRDNDPTAVGWPVAG